MIKRIAIVVFNLNTKPEQKSFIKFFKEYQGSFKYNLNFIEMKGGEKN